MTHNLVNTVSVLDLKQYKISALDIYKSNHLVIGCNDGSIRLLYGQEIKNNNNNNNNDSNNNNSYVDGPIVKNVGKQIELIKVCDDYNIAVIIIDGYITVFDLPSLKFHGKLESSKGCVTFEFNRYKAFMQTFMPSHGQTLMIAVGIRRKVIVYRWENKFFRQHTELALSSSPKSLRWAGKYLFVGTSRVFLLVQIDTGATLDITNVGKKNSLLMDLPKQEMVLVKDQNGLFVSWEGKTTRPNLVWMASPITLKYCHPYAIVALPNIVELRNMITLNIAQTIRFKGAKHLAINDNGNTIVLASAICIKRLQVVSLDEQLNNLIKRKEFTEAISLLQNCGVYDHDQQEEKLNELHILYAYHLFNEGEYETSMMNFQQSDLNPRQILAMFPDVMPNGQCRDVKHPVPVKPIHGEENLLRALSTLIPYLAQFRARLMLSNANQPRGVGKNNESPINNNSKLHNNNNTNLNNNNNNNHDDDDDDNNNNNINSNTDTKEMSLPVLVDTVLLKAYLLTDSNLVMPFLSQRNQCDIEESQNILRAYEKYAELVVLYRSNGYHKNALELLATLGQNANHLHPLYGSEETVKYLQTLSQDPQYTNLVLQFSTWVLHSDPDQGLRIFTHSHSNNNPSDGISPHVILEHLKRNCDTDIVIAYLESLVDNCHETNSVFHNELIQLYIEIIMKLLSKDKNTQLLHNPAGSELGRLGIIRKRLLQFLESSVYYIPEKMLVILSRFPRSSDMLEERAILLSRISQHAQALFIYARKLRNYKKAEEYCQQFYSMNTDEGKDVYLELLRVYLKPTDKTDIPLIKPALQLLSKHFNRINAAQALDLLPDDTPIHELAPFLNAIFRKHRQSSRDAQVVKNLRRAENIQVRREFLASQSLRVVITEDTQCDKCRNRIGNSAFHRYPNGVVVHYICSDDKYVCPITNRKFGSNNNS